MKSKRETPSTSTSPTAFGLSPLAVLPMLHYSRELKKIDVGGIYYGNFEAGSTIEGVIHAPLDELDRCPVFLGVDLWYKHLS